MTSSHFTSEGNEAQRLSNVTCKWQKQDVVPAFKCGRDRGWMTLHLCAGQNRPRSAHNSAHLTTLAPCLPHRLRPVEDG